MLPSPSPPAAPLRDDVSVTDTALLVERLRAIFERRVSSSASASHPSTPASPTQQQGYGWPAFSERSAVPRRAR